MTINKSLIEHYAPLIEYNTTLTKRGTFYHTLEDLQDQALRLHKVVLTLDRGCYLASLLGETTNYTKQLGLYNLLTTRSKSPSFITEEMEKAICSWLLDNLPPQKVLDVFLTLKQNRINNGRVRKVILKYILGPRLPTLAVKYRNKARPALTHAWGSSNTGVIMDVLQTRGKRKPHVKRYINKHLDKYTSLSLTTAVDYLNYMFKQYHCNFTVKKVADLIAAREDLSRGSELPPEVLMGIWSTYHKDNIDKSEVLKLAHDKGTERQKMRSHSAAKAAGVAPAEFKPERVSLIELFIYAYHKQNSSRGLAEEGLETYIANKVKSLTASIPKFKKVGIVVDTSRSMLGHDTQKYRPIASALAAYEILNALSEEPSPSDEVFTMLPEPQGETNLGAELMSSLLEEPEVIFILSDGYENAPAGRVHEIVTHLERIRRNQSSTGTKIFHINPTPASEVKGVRKLSDKITTLSLGNAEALPEQLFKQTLDLTTKEGIQKYVSFQFMRVFKDNFELPFNSIRSLTHG